MSIANLEMSGSRRKIVDHINQNSGKKVFPQKIQKGRQFPLKDQPKILFILVSICQLYSSLEIYIFFNTVMDPNLPWTGVWGPIIATSIFRVVVYFINTIYLGRFKLMLYAYTMLDILGVLAITCGVIFLAFLLSITRPMQQIVLRLPVLSYIFAMMQQIFYIGNFRAMMMTCKWGKCMVITYKIKLYLACMFYIIFGIIYTQSPYDTQVQCQPCAQSTCQFACRNSGFTLPCCDDVGNLLRVGFQTINNIFILYLATGFAYYSQQIAVMSDFDGISEMQVRYTMHMDDQQQSQSIVQNDIRNQQSDGHISLNIQTHLKKVFKKQQQ